MGQMLYFNEKLIFRLDASRAEEALAFLADQLCRHGCVTDGYKAAILRREQAYPTGLRTGGINVAVPHADCAYVKRDAVAVGILREPCPFGAMDDPARAIEVRLILMLALSRPHGQIEMLQKILALVQSQVALERIVSGEDLAETYRLIADYIRGGDER